MARTRRALRVDLDQRNPLKSKVAIVPIGKRANQGGVVMLFCVTANYTPQALEAMGKNPNTNPPRSGRKTSDSRWWQATARPDRSESAFPKASEVASLTH